MIPSPFYIAINIFEISAEIKLIPVLRLINWFPIVELIISTSLQLMYHTLSDILATDLNSICTY